MRTADQPGTSVVVPSLTLDQDELRKLDGATFYEERLLFLLIRLRNPRAHVVYVTSQPVHPLILDYYLHLLAGVPGQPRARAADDAVHVRRVAAGADAEDPRAAAPDRAHPRGDPRSLARLPHRLQLHAARAQAGGAAGHSSQRPRSRSCTTSAPSRAAARCSARPASSCRKGFEDLTGEADVEDALVELRAAAARPAQGRGEAERQLLRRGQRDLPLSRSRPTIATAIRKALRSRGVRGAVGNAPELLPEVHAHGRHRRGVHRRGDQDLAVGAAADEPGGRGAADLHPRPDPRRPVRAGVPGVQLPCARGLPDGDPAPEHPRRPGAREAGRRQSLRRRLPGLQGRARGSRGS